MFISVLFANGRWPRGEDVSVSQSRQSCDRRLGTRSCTALHGTRQCSKASRGCLKADKIASSEVYLNICSGVSGVRLGNR